MIFLEKILSIFDIENLLWKYNFSTFWWTIIHHRIVFKIIPLSMLILGQNSCVLGPTIFKIELTRTKIRCRFCKILWPSQNIWTLTSLYSDQLDWMIRNRIIAKTSKLVFLLSFYLEFVEKWKICCAFFSFFIYIGTSNDD